MVNLFSNLDEVNQCDFTHDNRKYCTMLTIITFK